MRTAKLGQTTVLELCLDEYRSAQCGERHGYGGV